MSRADQPAYPSHGTMGEVVQQGLTIREHFAAMAMQGILSAGTWSDENGRPFTADELAHHAVAHADALLATLQRPQRGEGE